MSERRSCSALGVERSSVRYISHKPDQTPLVMRIRDLAATRTRYGYFRIYILLRRGLRGPNGARDEFHMAATAQNLRKMAKLIPMPAQMAPA